MLPLINIALRAARKAGDLIERATENLDHLEIQSKSESDFVTEIDQAAEKEVLRRTFCGLHGVHKGSWRGNTPHRINEVQFEGNSVHESGRTNASHS